MGENAKFIVKDEFYHRKGMQNIADEIIYGIKISRL
jgi:hypothetical protein